MKKPAGGPLTGLKVIEFAGLGPGPFAAMLLSDSGADVVRIDRPNSEPSPHPVLERGRRSVVLDLKSADGQAIALKLAASADLLVESFRPGVMERLGLGPETLLSLKPSLVYARITGWGQTGPLAHTVGHDPNYVALTGAQYAIGTADRPVLPLNIVGDYGGGGMLLAYGVMAALWHARNSGEGQVVDVAIVDGVLSMMSALYGNLATGSFSGERSGEGAFGASPSIGLYRCADGNHVSLCAFEPRFFQTLLSRLGVADDADISAQYDKSRWPAARAKLEAIFLRKSRDEWCALLGEDDVCLSPVLSMSEAQRHPHNVARGAFVDIDGVSVPAPVPRFSATPAAVRGKPVQPGEDGMGALRDWGFSSDEIERLARKGALGATR
ncbi:MAG: CaiB/BaiF CoA-transferase family protein [Sphingobium sp.]